MSNFKELNENLDSVFKRILDNKNLCKLINYNSSDALSKDDLESPEELLYTKIFPYPRSTELFSEASSLLIVTFNNFEPISANNYLNKQLCFRILVHEDLWRLQEGLRPYLIMHEIANTFNGERLGIGKTLFKRAQELIGDGYMGFTLFYEITDFN